MSHIYEQKINEPCQYIINQLMKIKSKTNPKFMCTSITLHSVCGFAITGRNKLGARHLQEMRLKFILLQMFIHSK